MRFLIDFGQVGGDEARSCLERQICKRLNDLRTLEEVEALTKPFFNERRLP